ncbi:hypothetical protein K933_10779 [Candidatus Halobonum tyrrellensis G22]|uniref:Uncharacterized protein n=1 Tax=Candidatus Halobonum tyrrellensis G22 TaxID=1324957 RepID=V4HBE6_9EURY|nr:hypothetical protein K933_10779 [Candidatus Halobonum tyrrellensis G22]
MVASNSSCWSAVSRLKPAVGFVYETSERGTSSQLSSTVNVTVAVSPSRSTLGASTHSRTLALAHAVPRSVTPSPLIGSAPLPAVYSVLPGRMYEMLIF